MPEILNSWAAFEQKARTAYEQGNMPEAERHLVAAWNAMQQQGAPRSNLIETVGSLGFIREQQSNLNGALECYQNLLGLLQDMPNTETQVIRLLQKLSEIYHTVGNYRASEEYLNRLDQIKQELASKNPQRSAHSIPSYEALSSQKEESAPENKAVEQPRYGQSAVVRNTQSFPGNESAQTSASSAALENTPVEGFRNKS
jgi:tetratricopeptide (TPR) repeat protein